MKIVLRQVTVGMISFGRSAQDASANALQAHDHPMMKLLKLTVEPVNPERNKETADLFAEVARDSGRNIPGFQQDDPTVQGFMVTLVLEDSLTWLPQAADNAVPDQPEFVQPPQQASVQQPTQQSTAASQASATTQASSTALSGNGPVPGSPAPVPTPAAGLRLAEPGSELCTDQPPADNPAVTGRPPQPTVIAGLPPDAIQVGGTPAAPAVEDVTQETIPVPGRNPNAATPPQAGKKK